MKNSAKQSSSVKKVLKKIKPYSFYLILALVSAIISVSLTLYIPVLTGNAIDNIIDKGNVDFASVIQILVYIGVGIGGVALFQWIMTYFTNIVSYRTVRDLRREVFEKFNTVPLSYIDTTPHGDLISRVINDVDAVGDGLTQMFLQLFSGIVTIVGTLVFMLTINWKIALVVVVLTPLSLFVAAFIGKMTHNRFTRQQALNGDISSYVEEHIGNQRIVKAFSYEDRAFEEFEKYNDELLEVGFKAQFAGALANPSTRFVNALVYAAVGIMGALFAVAGTLSVGQLSCFLTYANQYTKPFNEISGVITELQNAIACAARVFELMEAEPQEPDSPDAIELTQVKGAVELKNVSFSYVPEQKLIEDFNLHVQPGQRIAIVGPTGCGKTTLINLLMRFYDIDSGKITIDGNDITKVTRDSLRRAFAMVLQDTWLFHGTIYENIAYGKPDATLEDVKRVCKAARIHNYIMRLPKQYDTVLTDDGRNISKGQKQLLTIARAMLLDAHMLILDEATSNVDTRTELQIQEAMLELMKDKTCFVIAHRLSTIQNADCILVVKEGEVIEQGTHDELMEKRGFYRSLYDSQFAGKQI